MGRTLGIDYGDARIGLSLSDETKFLASPLKMIRAKPKLEDTAKAIYEEISDRSSPEKIVLGLPLHLSGKESPSSLKVRELGTFLEQLFGVPVIFWDERLTTAQVERTLKEAEFSRKKRTKVVDSMAACVILQSYLDSPRI